jgi:hypothetical protein
MNRAPFCLQFMPRNAEELPGDRRQTIVRKERKADTRRYARFGILEYAMVFVRGSHEPLRSVIVDVGLGGLQILSRKPIEVGEICHLTIGKSDGSRLEVPGEVRFSKRLEDADGLFSTGMRFAPETHEQRSELVDYVHSVFQRQADMLTG